MYHLTVVSGGGPNAGTQYEQLVQKLMETDGDPSELLLLFWVCIVPEKCYVALPQHSCFNEQRFRVKGNSTFDEVSDAICLPNFTPVGQEMRNSWLLS
jgi:hypothetical protein